MSLVFQDLLAGSLQQAGWYCSLIVAFAGATGLALWLFGARFSQSFAALVMVAIGAFIGLRTPAWFSLPLRNWATAIGGALVLGVLGYLLYRVWIGAALAILLGAWAALVALGYYAPDFVLPTRQASVDFTDYLRQIWGGLPTEMRTVGAAATAAALISGVGLTILVFRTATYMFFSFLGVSLLHGAILLGRPQLLMTLLPSHPVARWGALAGLVLFGMLVQWRTAPAGPAAKPPAAKPKD